MALTGSNTEQKIWNFLKAKGLNDYGIAGLMGNLQAESALRPENLQNSYEKSLGYTDSSYTAAVDNGSYTNFVRDSAGYGLAQWTYWSRKQALLEYARAAGASIGDLEMQLGFLYKELSEGYKAVLSTLKTATSVLEASNAVLLKFERPAIQGSSVQAARAKYGQAYYDKYADQNAGYSVFDSAGNAVYEGKATPSYATYTVVKGDSLWKIAANKLGKGSRWPEIKALNGLKSNTIYAGQVLKIPAK